MGCVIITELKHEDRLYLSHVNSNTKKMIAPAAYKFLHFLSSQEKMREIPLPNLDKYFICYGPSTKPFSDKHKLFMAQQERPEDVFVLQKGNTHSLILGDNSKNFQFSSEPSPISCVVAALKSDKALMKISFNIPMSRIDNEIALTYQPIATARSEAYFQKKAFFEEFKKATWWGPDRLFEQYGGEEYYVLSSKQRIVFDSESVVYVDEGDLLVWENESWKKLTKELGDKNLPLAKIGSMRSSKMEITIWDEQGFMNTHFFLSQPKMAPFNLKGDDLITQIHQRSNFIVTCKLQGNKCILQKGDWVYHTSTGWKTIRTVEKMQKVLNSSGESELLVFDGIEKIQGSSFFKGHIFDRMRMQTFPIAIQIGMKKKESPIKSKKSATIAANPPRDRIDLDMDADEVITDEPLQYTETSRRRPLSSAEAAGMLYNEPATYYPRP